MKAVAGIAAIAALSLGVPAAHAAETPFNNTIQIHSASQQNANANIQYFSGGVGKDQRDQMAQMAEGFDLKLVFATQDGAYLSNIPVTIRNANGETVLSAVSEGPFFFADVPPGSYTVSVNSEGREKTIKLNVGQNSQMVERHIYWKGAA